MRDGCIASTTCCRGELAAVLFAVGVVLAIFDVAFGAWLIAATFSRAGRRARR